VVLVGHGGGSHHHHRRWGVQQGKRENVEALFALVYRGGLGRDMEYHCRCRAACFELYGRNSPFGGKLQQDPRKVSGEVTVATFHKKFKKDKKFSKKPEEIQNFVVYMGEARTRFV
jgi:hypothetical protein